MSSLLDDYVTADNPVRVTEAFIDALTPGALGFTRFEPAATGRPAYDPATLLKLYLYGYLNRVRALIRVHAGGPFPRSNAACDGGSRV